MTKPTSISTKVVNSFSNFVSGLGGKADKSSNTVFAKTIWDSDSLTDAYEGSWLAAKGVDVPIDDAMRGWRTRDGRILDIDTTLSTMSVVKEALQYWRVLGGSAILYNTGASDNKIPMGANERVVSIIAMSKDVLKPKDDSIITDASSPWFGLPEFFINGDDNDKSRSGGSSAGQKEIHISRLWIFPQHQAFRGSSTGTFWRDGILAKALEDINSAGSTLKAIEHLIIEMRKEVVKIPGLFDMCETDEGTQKLLKRFSLDKEVGSIFNRSILDSEEDISHLNTPLTNLDPLLKIKLEMVSSAFDIPVTKFFGSSPGGLNATGESDLVNYFSQVEHIKNFVIKPFLVRLDELTGKPNQEWEFQDSRPYSPKDKTENDTKVITAAGTLSELTTPEIAIRWLLTRSSVTVTKDEREALIGEI